MSGLYAKAMEGILDRTIDLTSATLKAVMIDTGAYTVDLAAHDFLDDVAGGSRIGTPVALSGKSYTGGKFTASAFSFTGLSSAPTCEAILYYIDTGTAATSRLVYYCDSGTGLPTPAGVSTINVTPDPTNGIFKLANA